MKCSEARSLLMVYLDSEADVRTSVEMGEHLDGCAECRRRFEAESRLESAIAGELHTETMPPEVWRSLQAALPRRRRQAWRWAAAAAMVLVALSLSLRVEPEAEGLMAEMILAHQGVVDEEFQLDLITDDRAEIEDFLAERQLGGLVVPEPGMQAGHEIALVGVRELQLAGQPAAAVLARCCGHPMSLFVMDRDRLDALPDEWQRSVSRGPVSRADLHAQAAIREDVLVSRVWSEGHEPPVLAGPASL